MPSGIYLARSQAQPLMSVTGTSEFAVDRQRPLLTAVVMPDVPPAQAGTVSIAGLIGDLPADVRVVVFARAADAESIRGGNQRTVIAVPDDLARDHRSLRRMAVQDPAGDVFRFLRGRDVVVDGAHGAGEGIKDRLVQAGVPRPHP